MADDNINNDANKLKPHLLGVEFSDIYSLVKIAKNNKTAIPKLAAAAKTPGPPQVKIAAIAYCFYDVWRLMSQEDKIELERITGKYGHKIADTINKKRSQRKTLYDKIAPALKEGGKNYTEAEVVAGIEAVRRVRGKNLNRFGKNAGKLNVAINKTEKQTDTQPRPPPTPKKRQWQLSTAVFPDGAGMITPHGKGPQYYNDGDEVTIQFTPNPGTNFLHFVVNGDIFNPSRVIQQRNRFLSPLSQQQQGERYVYILDIIMTMNISVQAICDGEPRSNAPTVNVGPTNVTTGPVHVNPNINVNVNGGAGGGENGYNLTCQVHPSTDAGTIVGFNNGETRPYKSGTIANVTAQSKEGARFLGWIINNVHVTAVARGNLLSLGLRDVDVTHSSDVGSGLKIRMNSNYTVMAIFEGGGAPVDFEATIEENRHDGIAEQTSIEIWAKVKGGKNPYTYQWRIEDDEGDDAIQERKVTISAGGVVIVDPNIIGPLPATGIPENIDNFSVVFNEAGTYHIRLLVLDSSAPNKQRAIATAQKTIRAPFSVKIKEDKHSGDEPLVVKLWAEVEDTTKPLKWEWDFGDGSTSTDSADSEDKAISHTFMMPPGVAVNEQVYKVKLTITNGRNKRSIASANKTVKKKKEDGKPFKVIGPKKPSFLGALERGAYNRTTSDQTTGMKTMLPKLRIAINKGRRELSNEARNFTKQYVNEIKEQTKQVRKKLTKARKDYLDLLTDLNSGRRYAAVSSRIQNKVRNSFDNVGKGANISELINMVGGAIADINKSNNTGTDATFAEELRERYNDLQKAQEEYEKVAKGYAGDNRVRQAQLREELEKLLDGKIDQIATSLKYRYHLIGMPGSGSGQDLSGDLKEVLKGEAAWLAEWWSKWAVSLTTRVFGSATIGLRRLSFLSQGIGDVWDTITSNLWAFLTGPIIWGTIIIAFQFGFMAAYAPPDLPGFLYYFPLISGVLIWLINFANIKFFLETFDHLISGIIIGYGVTMLVASLGLYYVFGLSGWMGTIVYVIIVGVLWLIGAFQIYAAGGFRVVVPIALIIMLFAWFSLGPYSGYIREIRDQVVAPLKQVVYYVGDAVNDIWLLMTNPTEYFAQQQLKSARPEKALSYPKGIEAVRLDILPEQVEEGGEFALYAVIKNDGEQKAENIKVLVTCKSDRYIPDNKQSNLASLKCKEVNPTPIPPQSPGKPFLNPGDGDTYQFLLNVGHMTPSGTLDTPFLTYTTNVKRVVFNKINLSVEYTYATSSELTTEVATETEIERRQLAKEQFYYQQIATAKVGPAMVGMTVGYQPLVEGRNAILLINVLNKRPDGFVVLDSNTPLVISIPNELRASGAILDCQSNLKATASCTGGTCTITPKTRIEINNKNYKESLAMICKFIVAKDTLLTSAGSRTGVITATLKKYNFVYISEKDVAIIPSPELTGQQSQLSTCAQWFDEKKANFHRITGLAIDSPDPLNNPFNWYQIESNRNLIKKVADDKKVSVEEIITVAYYKQGLEGGTSSGVLDDNIRGRIVQIAREHGVNDEGVRWILKTARLESGFGHCRPESEGPVGEQGTCPSGQKVKCSSSDPQVKSCGVMQKNIYSNPDCYQSSYIHSSGTGTSCSKSKYCQGKYAWDLDCNIDSGIIQLLDNGGSSGNWENAVKAYNPGDTGYLESVRSQDISTSETFIAKYPLGSATSSTTSTTTSSDVNTALAALRKDVDDKCPTTNDKEAQLNCVADQILAVDSATREKIKQSALYQQCKVCFPLVEKYSGSSGTTVTGNAANVPCIKENSAGECGDASASMMICSLKSDATGCSSSSPNLAQICPAKGNIVKSIEDATGKSLMQVDDQSARSEQLKQIAASGKPIVIGSVFPNSDGNPTSTPHYMVITGYDSSTDKFTVNNPNVGSCSQQTVSGNYFFENQFPGGPGENPHWWYAYAT